MTSDFGGVPSGTPPDPTKIIRLNGLAEAGKVDVKLRLLADGMGTGVSTTVSRGLFLFSGRVEAEKRKWV